LETTFWQTVVSHWFIDFWPELFLSFVVFLSLVSLRLGWGQRCVSLALFVMISGSLGVCLCFTEFCASVLDFTLLGSAVSLRVLLRVLLQIILIGPLFFSDILFSCGFLVRIYGVCSCDNGVSLFAARSFCESAGKFHGKIFVYRFKTSVLSVFQLVQLFGKLFLFASFCFPVFVSSTGSTFRLSSDFQFFTVILLCFC
jgi:hypothetical protein